MRIKRTIYLVTLCGILVGAACTQGGAQSTTTTQKQSTGIQSTSTQGQTASPAPGPNATTVSDAQTAKKLREPDVIYVPTPPEVVDAMLKVANVRRGDVHYDLGSGDGRIVITAAQKFGTRSTGIDINPERIKEANANAQKAGVTDRVRFLNEDLFEANISDATVVTLYLLNSLNLRLLPKLLKEVKPGTRIVSHAFDMGSWKPEQTLNIDGRSVFFWTIPEKGTPAYAAALAAASGNSGTQN